MEDLYYCFYDTIADLRYSGFSSYEERKMGKKEDFIATAEFVASFLPKKKPKKKQPKK